MCFKWYQGGCYRVTSFSITHIVGPIIIILVPDGTSCSNALHQLLNFMFAETRHGHEAMLMMHPI